MSLVRSRWYAAVFLLVIGAAPAFAALPPWVQCEGCWLPSVGARWQIQLQGVSTYASTGGINVNITAVPAAGGAPVAPEVFDIDLYVDQAVSGRNDVPNTAAVDAIHARGGHVICYVSAGSWENWRPDAGAYPETVLGRKNGWPGERWVDIRRIDVLDPILSTRAYNCKQAGFDAIEWDNVDGYQNRTGFSLTANDQLEFNAYLANLAHHYGLSVALKNDLGQLSTLKPYFDFAINEECFRYRECDYPPPGLPGWTAPDAGTTPKAVFQVEYRSLNCSQANAWNFGAILKGLDLYDVPWKPCR
jgi:hypothetical protein